MFTSFTPTPICGCIQCRRIAWRLIAHQVGIDNFHAAERTLHATETLRPFAAPSTAITIAPLEDHY